MNITWGLPYFSQQHLVRLLFFSLFFSNEMSSEILTHLKMMTIFFYRFLLVPVQITNLTSAPPRVCVCVPVRPRHIHTEEGRREDQRHLQAPGWVPTLGYIWCCGWNKREEERRRKEEGGVWGGSKPKRMGLWVCVCVGYTHICIQSYMYGDDSTL